MKGRPGAPESMFEHLHSEESRAADPRGESGQVTIIVVFGALAFVLLAAFVYNTAVQTSRKIEMQGAADAAAVAGGVWMARGMNMTALNNNTMTEMLSIMITTRSILQTLQIEHNILNYLSAVPYVGVVARIELIPVRIEMQIWQAIDRTLNQRGGVGWTVLTGLDSLNRGVKLSFPKIAPLQSVHYASINGADQFPHGWLIPGKSAGFGFALYPLSRGPRTLIVEKAQECALRRGGPLRRMAYLATVRGPITGIISLMHLQDMFDRNIDSLMGRNVGSILRAGGLGSIISRYIPFGVIVKFLESIFLSNPPVAQPLRWQADPKPMILSETGAETTNNTRPSLRKVREFLQYLAVALGQSHAGSPIGGEKFLNPSFLPRITYAQVDVYNPTKWDMFTQDWRAKLVRARLLDTKCRDLGQKLGVSALCGQGWSFVNTH